MEQVLLRLRWTNETSCQPTGPHPFSLNSPFTVKSDPNNRTAHILGLGLDNKDGHKRLTQGDDFTIAGGSAETHERMTETMVKTFEDLKRKGRTLAESDPREVAELVHKHTPRD